MAYEYKKEQVTSQVAHQFKISTASLARIHVYKANPKAKIESISSGVVTFVAPNLSQIPRLPNGYGFKGVAARIALAALLGHNVKRRVPRDWDIIRIGTDNNPQDRVIAKKFMPEDFKYGHGVELIKDLRTYLHARDITINQIALLDSKIIATFAAIEDTLNSLLRTTDQACNELGFP